MKKSLSVLCVLLFAQFTLAQVKIDEEYFARNGEVYFRMAKSPELVIQNLSKIISIDNVTRDSVYAYANEQEFYLFLKYEIPFQHLKHPGDVENIKMSSSVKEILQWNSYPTYEAYVSMMNQFQTNYPSLCRIVDAGTTIQGRKILFAVISDNVSVKEAEPKFQYSSTMHGDETTGYVLMLRLIDYLLANYTTDPKAANLVNNLEIWINPNANPDGTYRSGNSTVTGARRGNANNIDLNRNFPDPRVGLHPDGNAWQPETIAMMNLAQANRFIHSANFHGGAEVINYPWDTWAQRHPDDNWYIHISRLYADTVHAASPSTSYMRGFNNGITNGYDWYTIAGGRQDYMNYFAGCREVTVEISNTKLVAGSLLPTFWNYNRKSLLYYMENTLYGVHGIISEHNGNPLKAKVTVVGHDAQNSHIFSDSLLGNYHRLINAGNYTFTFSADSFVSRTISNVSVSNRSTTTLNVQLLPTNLIPVELISFSASNINGKVKLEWSTATETNNKGFEIEKNDGNNEWAIIGFVSGKGTTTKQSDYSFTDGNKLTGLTRYRLKQIDFDGSFNYPHSGGFPSNIVEVNLQLTEFVLYQNYPNPFNPVTVISWQLPVAGHVSLKVYDVLGNEVAQLVNEVKQAGVYEVEFSGSQLAAGIYFYRFESANFVSTKKFVLLK